MQKNISMFTTFGICLILLIACTTTSYLVTYNAGDGTLSSELITVSVL